MIVFGLLFVKRVRYPNQALKIQPTLKEVMMPRKTLIFGNGLGMALDPQHFSLTNAMADVWNDPFAISDVHKELISQCLGGNGVIPAREDQLDPLHLVISACRTLSSINMSQRMNVHWLSQEGLQFPVAVGNYLHKVAMVCPCGLWR